MMQDDGQGRIALQAGARRKAAHARPTMTTGSRVRSASACGRSCCMCIVVDVEHRAEVNGVGVIAGVHDDARKTQPERAIAAITMQQQYGDGRAALRAASGGAAPGLIEVEQQD